MQFCFAAHSRMMKGAVRLREDDFRQAKKRQGFSFLGRYQASMAYSLRFWQKVSREIHCVKHSSAQICVRSSHRKGSCRDRSVQARFFEQVRKAEQILKVPAIRRQYSCCREKRFQPAAQVLECLPDAKEAQ